VRRVRGSGTIGLRQADGMWVARVDLGGTPRRRKTFNSKDRATAERKMREWLEANRPHLAAIAPAQPRGRQVYMQRARELGTHTSAQWRAKQAEQAHLCHYCKRPVGAGGMKDHYVPVSRGGSDGIDNIVLACWDCNSVKSDMMPDDFIAMAQETGLFEEAQRTTVSHHGRNLRIPPEVIAIMRIPKGERWAWIEKQRRERGRNGD
jgi:hypothetical protein